jgi:hypothetical protein
MCISIISIHINSYFFKFYRITLISPGSHCYQIFHYYFSHSSFVNRRTFGIVEPGTLLRAQLRVYEIWSIFAIYLIFTLIVTTGKRCQPKIEMSYSEQSRNVLF